MDLRTLSIGKGKYMTIAIIREYGYYLMLNTGIFDLKNSLLSAEKGLSWLG